MVQERAIRTRQAILDAARSVFADSGYDGARVDEIARRSGANKQRIYAYFTDKAGLFAEVQREAIAQLADFEATLLPMIEAAPANLGRQLVEGYLRFHEEHPQFWRLIAWSNLGRITPPQIESPRAPILLRLREAFALAQDQGAVQTGISFDAWFVTLSSVVLFLFANQRSASVNLGIDLGQARTRRRIVDDLLALLHHGSAAAAKNGSPIRSH